jgi:hypothetical protein
MNLSLFRPRLNVSPVNPLERGVGAESREGTACLPDAYLSDLLAKLLGCDSFRTQLECGGIDEAEPGRSVRY